MKIAEVHERRPLMRAAGGAIQGSEIPPRDVPAHNDRTGRAKSAALFSDEQRRNPNQIPAHLARPVSYFGGDQKDLAVRRKRIAPRRKAKTMRT
jgi:hypothetical protein